MRPRKSLGERESGCSWEAARQRKWPHPCMVAQMAKNLSVVRRPRFDLWVRKIPWRRKGRATHSCILAWRIPWTEVPGGLQSTGVQRVRHNTRLSTHYTLHFGITINDVRKNPINMKVLPLTVAPQFG